MTSFRDSIRDDFQDVCDDLESVTLWSRATGQPVALCGNAKRSLNHNDQEEFNSFGFAVSDSIKFQIALADLPLNYRVMLGDWIVDSRQGRYVIASVFDSRMTSRLRVSCVSLAEVFNTTVDLMGRAPESETGAPGAQTIPLVLGVPAAVWAVDQGDDSYLGDNLKPRFRCAFHSDGSQIALPLPQGSAIRHAGKVYDVTAVTSIDKLVGFAVCELAILTARRDA